MSRRGEWTEIAAISVVSIVLYQFNVLVLFLVPLQIVFVRRGERSLLLSCAAVFATTATVAAIRLSGIDDEGIRRTLLLLEVLLPFVLVGGIAAVNIRWPKVSVNGRALKLVLTTMVIGILSIPAVMAVARNDGLNRFFLDQISALRDAITYSVQGDPALSGALAEMLSDPEWLAELAARIMLQTYLFSYFVLVAGSVWVGDFAAAKTLGSAHRRLFDVRLPDSAVWALIVAWTIVLIDLIVDIGAVRYVGWNFGLIMLLMYGLQGGSILRHMLVRRGASAFVRIALGVALVLMLFWPLVNLAVIIGLPGLGVSETWIRYRNTVKE